MGLFIIQEIRKDYNELDNKKHSFQEFNDEAAKVINNDIYVDVDDELFSKPRDMLNKYYSYLKNTNFQKKCAHFSRFAQKNSLHRLSSGSSENNYSQKSRYKRSFPFSS